jgi:Gpi18-like mannosyltransferase
MLVRLVASMIGWDHAVLAALLVSNLGTLAAFIGLGLLAANEYGQQTASYAIRAVAAYPLAFFLFAGYSDGLFLALVTFTLLFARRGLWLEAAACTFLACFTRPTAVVLILPLLWEYGRQHRELFGHLRQALTPRIVGEVGCLVLSMPVAFGIWEAYLWTKFHDPMVFFKAQKKYWDHATLAPWNTVHLAIHTLQRAPNWSFVQSRILLDVLPVVAVAVLTILIARRIPISFGLYLVGVLAILTTAAVPLNYDPLNAEGRYVLMAVPIFLILGRWMKEHARVDLLIVSGGFMLQGLFTAFWLRGGWIV